MSLDQSLPADASPVNGPPSPPRWRPNAWQRGLLMLAVFPVGLAILRWGWPLIAPLYPKCLWHELTGLYCAGCGLTRAMRALAHGDLAAAVGHNALFVLMIVGYLLNALHEIYAGLGGRRLYTWTMSKRLLWLLGTLVVGYMFVRNLPLAPFSMLAP